MLLSIIAHPLSHQHASLHVSKSGSSITLLHNSAVWESLLIKNKINNCHINSSKSTSHNHNRLGYIFVLVLSLSSSLSLSLIICEQHFEFINEGPKNIDRSLGFIPIFHKNILLKILVRLSLKVSLKQRDKKSIAILHP